MYYSNTQYYIFLKSQNRKFFRERKLSGKKSNFVLLGMTNKILETWLSCIQSHEDKFFRKILRRIV